MTMLWRLLILTLQALLWLGFTLLLTTAVVVGVGRSLMPRLGEFTEQISAEANRRCACRITFQQIEGRWERVAPIVRLHGLKIEATTAPKWSVSSGQVEFSIDLLRSLRHWQPRLNTLSAQEIALSIETESKGAKHSIESWLAPIAALETVQRLDLSDIRLLWHDTKKQSQPISVMFTRFDLERTGTSYRIATHLKLDETAPAATAILHLHEVNGLGPPDETELYLQLPSQPLGSNWLKLLGLPQLESVETAVQLWADFKEEQLVNLTGEVSAGRWRVPNMPVAADSKDPTVQLDFHYQQADPTVKANSLARPAWQLALDPRILLPNEPVHATHITLIGAGDPHQAAVELVADQIDLAPWRHWLSRMQLLPERWQQLLERLAPVGQMQDIHLLAPNLTTEALDDFELSSRLTAVGVNAWDGAPALSGVEGELFIKGGAGLLQFDSHRLGLHFPLLFNQGWQFDTARGALFWQITPDLIEVSSDRIALASPRYGAQGLFRLLLPRHAPEAATLGLSIGINPANLLEKDQFLPRLRENAKLIDWLRSSLTTGELDQGSVIYQGSINIDAAENSKRTLLFFRGHDIQLRFDPAWPALAQLAGSVSVSDADLDLSVTHGSSGGIALQQAKVAGKWSESDQSYHLKIDSELAGNLAEAKQWLLTTPLRPELMPWLGELELTGPLQARLALELPISAQPKVDYQLDLKMANSLLKAPNYGLRYDRISGDLRLSSAKGIQADRLQARFLGQPVRVHLQQSSDPAGRSTVLLTQEGRVSVIDLADLLDLAPLDYLSGEIHYLAQLQLPEAGGASSDLTIESDLVGLNSTLPAPLRKQSENAVPLLLQTRFSAAGLQSLSVLFNEEMGFDLEFNAEGRDRGQILLGKNRDAGPLSSHNPLQGSLPPIDLDQWLDFYRTHLAKIAGIEKTADWFSDVGKIDFSLPQLRFLGQEINNVQLSVIQQQELIDLQISSDKVRGTIKVALDHSAPIQVMLDQLTFTIQTDSAGSDPLASFDPASLPALDFHAAAVMLNQQPLGSWKFQLRPTSQGVSAQQIDVSIDGFNLRSAMLLWQRNAGGQHHAHLTGAMQGGDIAQLARYFGVVPGISSESAQIDFNLAWPGSPAYFSLDRATGDYRLLFQNGRFETGGGTSPLGLFSLFNFNDLIRKLRLNLTDLGGESLSYQRVEGRLKLAGTVLTMDDRINIESATGRFRLAGTVDLASQNLDLDMAVTLPIGTNLPWYVAAIGGLPTAAAVFIAGKLFESPITQLASARYEVTGAMSDPRITLVELFQDQPTGGRRQIRIPPAGVAP